MNDEEYSKWKDMGATIYRAITAIVVTFSFLFILTAIVQIDKWYQFTPITDLGGICFTIMIGYLYVKKMYKLWMGF